MGPMDLFKPQRTRVRQTRSALEAANDPDAHDDGAVGRLVDLVLRLGLDGAGPLHSAQRVANETRAETGTVEKAVAKVARNHLIGGTVGGFVTGVGGFVTMPVALPANVLEFYVQATRMVGAIAALRGYDLKDQHVRTAILLTLIGSQADDVLRKAGMSTGGGALTNLAFKRLPPAALLVVNKGIGFRLLRGVGEKAFARLGRGVPFVGGVIGGGVDGWMMKRIADHAMKEFPQK